jgi:intron-binding protein aquarius
VNALLHDLNLLPAIRLSPFFGDEKNELLRDLYGLLRHFAYFSVDDVTGTQLNRSESDEIHNKALARLQRAALKHFRDKLTILALNNYGSISSRSDLQGHLSPLNDEELVELCSHLGFRTAYPKNSKLVRDRSFFTEVLLAAHERKKTFQDVVSEMSIRPTEEALFEPTLLRNETYSGSRPLAIPKLNLQYLTVGDFLWRSFILHRCEAFFEIRSHIESTITRLRPQYAPEGDGSVKLEGFSKMALPISRPAILEAAPPKVGHSTPAFVRAEIALDFSRLGEHVRREWESLRPDDVVFLLALKPSNPGAAFLNGQSVRPALDRHGILYLRTAEVVQIHDEHGRPIREANTSNSYSGGYHGGHRPRKLIVNLNPDMYKVDSERAAKGKPDVYEAINVIVRRRGRENNFKPILSSLRSLVLSDVPIPDWLQETFLGYGDPAAASYTRLDNRIRKLDFRDTFLDWQHVVESLPGRTVRRVEDKDAGPESMKVLEFFDEDPDAVPERPSKRRKREQPEQKQASSEFVKVSTYDVESSGPYPTDAPKLNRLRFTPKQVEAIIAGTQPGLTVIVGPPGTGKTDVATQIINNLYHNFPNQRTLLIAHSNQALNQLFQKIIDLDIDERHLLRLGHGEEDLASEGSWSKHGRVESFLQNRVRYLQEVDRLAACLNAPGAHGNSCETAAYFNTVYVVPAWRRYQPLLESPESTAAELVDAFPFTSYFANAPQPLFPESASKAELRKIIRGCYRHIEKVFSELEDIRPFEILRGARDKANYLLVKEARIIAMTSTHAAMRRQDIAALGFRYDNVVMEEAAQITEMENFVPLALQAPKDGQLPLQRVVLCGDHLQNSPIIQNLAFRQYANLEQSMFLRLIRLGVPTITLDQQGRARPSLARLYKWRYMKLGNLPNVENETQFRKANAGFRYEYQFINVPDYKGVGEAEPTPHYIHNLGEAEYAVALYQYMRLLGYPAASISILATYAGQKALIKDVLHHRCARNPLFGLPKVVTTVDKYQGEQNDCKRIFSPALPSSPRLVPSPTQIYIWANFANALYCF